ncbi:hypothetical protein FB451DRAFT_1161975 [Mycena latifolia]|nr:hypothetical protein FB451DRAFT_1161975 [Mycena latifolia]
MPAIRTAAYISSLPHPGPPPTCPLPPLPTQVTRAQTPVPVKQTPLSLPKLPEGYAFIPPSVPLTYPASYHLIPAGPMNAAPKRRVRLPKRKEPEADLADESFCCKGGAAGYDGSEMVVRTEFSFNMAIRMVASLTRWTGRLFDKMAIRMVAPSFRWPTVRWQGRRQWVLGDHSDFLLLGLRGILGSGGSSQWLSHSTRIRALGDFMISFGFWGQTG